MVKVVLHQHLVLNFKFNMFRSSLKANAKIIFLDTFSQNLSSLKRE